LFDRERHDVYLVMLRPARFGFSKARSALIWNPGDSRTPTNPRETGVLEKAAYCNRFRGGKVGLRTWIEPAPHAHFSGGIYGDKRDQAAIRIERPA